ncbi:hypothetical protein [Streptomyces sp. RerS4]|uniref:hypothetical protein n=1 Tax=Streptomyces sp. RerS4 TaxID=2942449 RepID=UPI00201BD096|nr:hypothetical protein [Streptomyces sp. RerS4]UQX04409.1 hypothetical protein M4D82_30820 [Streptomyces sp. RerS4]
MSTPPPPPGPAGPYGSPQPPQYPQPYGAQPYAGPQPPYAAAPPHPGRPYPQQQPYPGHGQWGQPPMGQPPMGQPPMGPPPRGNRTGLVVGIVVGLVVVLGVVGFLVIRLAAAGSTVSGAGFPAATHRLTVPQTLLDGKFQLVEDLSQTQGAAALKGTYDPKVRNPKPAVGQYTSGPPTEASALVISGMYGQFKDPASARRKMAAGATDADGATLAVPARDVTPPGSDITLTCQVLTSKQNGITATLPMCAWADGNTAASVAVVTPETTLQPPASVNLVKIAETTLKVRTETRQPLG